MFRGDVVPQNVNAARAQEPGGIIAILEMVKDEVVASTDDDNEAEADYEKFRGAFHEILDVQTEQELVELHEYIADTREIKDSKASDLTEEQALEASLEKDCAWAESYFESP